MEDTNSAVSRRRFVGFASALGAVPLFGLSPRAALAAQDASGEAFPNGIDVTRYVGGDGSYQKYRDEGIRLGLIEAFPVNFTDENGKRTGWNTDIVMRALQHSGIGEDKVEFVEGPWESMVPGLQSGRFYLLASDVHVTPDRI